MSRIIMLVTGLGMGGAEKQVIDLSRELSRREHQVLVVTMIEPSDWGLDLLGDAAEISSLSMQRGSPNPRALFRFRRTADAWSPNIVHSHMIHSNLLSRTAMVGSGIPLINTIHNIAEGGRTLDQAQRLTRGVPAWTTVVSHAAYQRHQRDRLISTTRSSVIYNGVAEPERICDAHIQWNQQPGESFRWLAIGRLEPQKNYATMIKAFAVVVSEDSRARLTIAGEGEDRFRIRDEINRLDLEESVSLVGRVQDVGTLLSEHHAVINASLWEGLPVSLIEAASHSRPAVATDVGGTSEVVADSLGGYLATPDQTSISQAMLRMMNHSAADFRDLGAEARRRYEELFTLAEVARSWESLYQHVGR